MTKKTWPFYISFLLLILVGCQNGCTTRSIMKQEVIVLTRSGEKIVVVAKLLDFRNSKRKYSKRLFPRKITHTYGIEFDISGLGLKQLHFHSVDINNPNSVDLDKYLQNVKVAVSKDKYHLAVGYNQELLRVFHLFKGEEISMLLGYSDPSSWKSLNINSYPSPKELILKELNENCTFGFRLEQNVRDLFEDLKPSDSAHVILLNNWPDCRVANGYYQGAKLRELAKNKTWKTYAIARAEEVINNRLYSYKFSENLHFYEALESDKLNTILADYIIENWQSESSWQLTNFIIKDAKLGKSKINENERDRIYSEAQSVLNNFYSKGKVNFTEYPEKCLAVSIAYGDTTSAYQLIEEGIVSKKSKFNAGTLTEILYKNEYMLTKYQQKRLNENIESYFDQISKRDKENVFRIINQFEKCSLLRKWKNKYPDELRFAFLTHKC